MESKIVYFDKPGGENTEAVLRLVRERAEARGIKTVLVASTRGDTAARAVVALKGLRVICVSHSTGLREPDVQSLTKENRKIIESHSGTVFTATHAFAGVSRALRYKFETVAIGEIIAGILRVFGEGMKVVCEITMMAADAGLVRTDEEVIAIGGTGRGADTAVVLNPVHTHHFFDLKVKEILCKPHF